VINIHQDYADECILVQPTLFGQYGKIMSISVKKNKGHSKKHYDNPAYSAYITFRNEIEASLCILSVDGCDLGGQKLSASYGMTKYCSYYLDDQNCRNENCLFLHTAASKEDSFSLYDKQSRGYPTRSSKTDIFELIGNMGFESFAKYRATIRRISEKISRDAKNEKQFMSSDSESEMNERLPSPLDLLVELKGLKPKLFVNKKVERENQSLKPVLDKEINPNVNKSWHFSLVKDPVKVKTKPIKSIILV
jgi:CCR4-NOT transcription complex subunit 4